MANDNQLHQIDDFDLDQVRPRIPWTKRDKDGNTIRNAHEEALAARDRELLTLIQVLKNQAISNVSPIFPFKEDATRQPSNVVSADEDGAEITAFTIDPSNLTLSTDFIKDMKLITSSDFSEPFISTMTLRQTTDPATNLIVVFIDIEVSARYNIDQLDHPILKLESKAYNDVLDNSVPSSRDNVSFNMVALPVGGQEHLNSGIIEFSFLGSVHSLTDTSWSIGELDGTLVEGFTAIPELFTITYTFEREATKLTQLTYNELGDLRNAVPFLAQVRNYPFDIAATAGGFFASYIKNLNITLPATQHPFIKRIRRETRGSDDWYIFVFSYNEYDSAGNYLRTINIGKSEIGPGMVEAQILSLGSNQFAGNDPDWEDEIIGQTQDNMGRGILVISSYEDMAIMFSELIEQTAPVGSSPIDASPTSPVVPPQFIGVTADPDLILLTDDSSRIDMLLADGQGYRTAVYERELATTVHPTRNVQVTTDGVLLNRRTTYGNETVMRDFYGLNGVESLIDNPNIPLDDEWFDSDTKALKRYQIVDGKRRWRDI